MLNLDDKNYFKESKDRLTKKEYKILLFSIITQFLIVIYLDTGSLILIFSLASIIVFFYFTYIKNYFYVPILFMTILIYIIFHIN